MMTIGPTGVRIAQDDGGIVTVLLDLPGKVNIMNDDFMAAMDVVLDRLENRTDYAGVIFGSAKPVFLAGGDLKRMSQAAAGQEPELFDYFEKLKSYLRRLERLGRPVVAAIAGTAVGGGYETCLACHHRVALRSPKTRIGLPEVEFGILAGAGGVVRLTRLIGFPHAAPFLARGTLVDVDGALEAGLIDDLADDGDALMEKCRAWIRANPRATQPWDRDRMDTRAQRRGSMSSDTSVAEETKRIFGETPVSEAAARNLSLAAESLDLDFDAALQLETRAVVELLLTDTAQRLIRDFFESRSAPVQRSEARAES